jgi:hypothetical protein
MNTRKLHEAAGPLAGLPKHWTEFLTSRWGKPIGQNMAGEHSQTIKLPKFDPKVIRKALKDENNLAVIGKKEGQPLFMISKHDQGNKYYFFEAEKSEGMRGAKGMGYYSGRRRRHYNYDDKYTLDEIISVVDAMKGDTTFDDLEIFAITKDPKRNEIIKGRQAAKSVQDPLEKGPYYSDVNPAQTERAKKYANIKRPKLDARIDSEGKRIKMQINNVVDEAIAKIIDNVKNGYTFSVSPSALASEIAKRIDFSRIQNLAQGYSAIRADFNAKPAEMAQKLKRTGLA